LEDVSERTKVRIIPKRVRKRATDETGPSWFSAGLSPGSSHKP